jgi:N-acetylglucosamine repressor
MNKPRRGDRDLIKAMNRNLILNILRRQGPLSRTQLTEISGLSVGAISQITSDLLDESWIIEIGEGDYTGGRRQMMLRLNPTAGYVVGLKLMENRIVGAVADLEATVLKYFESRATSDHTPTVVSAALAQAVERALDDVDIPREKVLGVGIGLAGVIDCEAGIVRYSPFFQWKDVPLADLLAMRLNLPVHLENDVNTLTITEQLFGPGHDVADFAVVTVGRGIGMGIVVNYQLYQGTHGGAGELGHITIDPNGPVCKCGKRGCLEALAADPAVLRAVEMALAKGAHSSIVLPPTMEEVTQAAEQGDSLAQETLARAGYYLGMGLAVVINMLCPALIIVSGEGVAAGDHRLQPMFEAMREHTFNGLLDNVQIMVKPTDDQTWARGAAGLVVGKVFESPLIKEREATESV